MVAAPGGVVVAIDAGTTGVRSVAVSADGAVVASSYREFPQYFPRPGWVEHDAEDIWQAVVATLSDVAASLNRAGSPIAAIGITDQRETVVLWDRRRDVALGRAVVWQDRRSAELTAGMEAAGHLPLIRERTGLVLDPYFSASKLSWLLGTGPAAGGHGEHPPLEVGPDTAFGTVDSWLLWRLSGGRLHATDTTNASRTLLFDISRLRWDPDLLELFGLPPSLLPEIVPSSCRLTTTAAGVVPGLAEGIPVSGVAGDQQAALFGQACLHEGMTKNTYGTGSFVLMNVGSQRPAPVEGLLTTVAWSLGEVAPGATTYALEGSVFVTGAAVQWLRDGLGIISESAEIGPLAASVADTGGAYFVPALTGLGSPWWDPHARGTVVGLSRGVTRAHLARAAVEAMAYQTADVVDAMAAASGHALRELRVDGGASVMPLLLQMQADLLNARVRRSVHTETTAVGAALLAGLAEDFWSREDVEGLWRSGAEAAPANPDSADATASALVEAGRAAWHRAVERSRGWASSSD